MSVSVVYITFGFYNHCILRILIVTFRLLAARFNKPCYDTHVYCVARMFAAHPFFHFIWGISDWFGIAEAFVGSGAVEYACLVFGQVSLGAISFST